MHKRIETALLVGFGFFNVYALRVNLSVAVVDMQNEYNWSDSLKGLLSCRFCLRFQFILFHSLGQEQSWALSSMDTSSHSWCVINRVCPIT